MKILMFGMSDMFNMLEEERTYIKDSNEIHVTDLKSMTFVDDSVQKYFSSRQKKSTF